MDFASLDVIASDIGLWFLFFVEMSDGADPDDGAISVTDTIE
jgi:hypothetical protein